MAQNFDTLFDLKSVQNMMNSFLSAPTGDMKSLMDTQLKNMKALNQTQQKMVETMQAAGKLQMQMLGDIMDSSSSIIREVSTEGTPQEKIAKQTALSKKAYEKYIKDVKAFADLSCESGKDFSDLMQKQMTNALGELKTSLEQSISAKKAA